MKNKYKYKGKVSVIIDGVGLVEPGSDVETEVKISHPDFEEVGSKQKKEKEKGKGKGDN